MSGTPTPVPPTPAPPGTTAPIGTDPGLVVGGTPTTPPIQGPGTLPEYPPGSAVPISGAVASFDGFDYRKSLWVAVVVERIREAGDVPVGTPCDDADFALARFDRVFGAPTWATT